MNLTSRMILSLPLYGLILASTAIAAEDVKPKGMDPLLAEAIQRLPMGTDTLMISHGPRKTVADVVDPVKFDEVSKQRAQCVDTEIYGATLQDLSFMADSHEHLFEKHKIKWCLESLPGFKASLGFADHIFDTVSVFVFETTDTDPTTLLLNALEKDAKVTWHTFEEVRFARREVHFSNSQRRQPMFCWRPRPQTLVIVRGDKSLSEALRRWKAPDLVGTPLPWDMDAWQLYDPSATTWALRKAMPNARKYSNFSAFLMTVNPQRDPESIQLTWCGRGTGDFGSAPREDDGLPFPGPAFFTGDPAELVRPEDKPVRINIKHSLHSEKLRFSDLLFSIRYSFGHG